MIEPGWLQKERKSSAATPEVVIDSPKDLRISAKNVRLFTLEEMLDKDPGFAKKAFLSRSIRQRRGDCAGYLNNSFRECNFMFVDKGKNATLDVHSDSALSMNFIFLAEGSSLRISTLIVSDSYNSFEIKADENSKVDTGLLKQKGAFAYHNQAATAQAGSTVNFAGFWSGSGCGETSTRLTGVGSKATHVALSTGGDEEKLKLNSSVIHSANNTHSDLIMRGVAQDRSSTSFQGTVDVESNGRGSKSSLKQEILLLDRDARAEARPVLEIKNNDVECSHAAAVRQIEEEKLFYLQSRGLQRDIARSILITGFLRSAISRIDDKELRNLFKPPFMAD
jgi:Fe-S cluster assembly scaffold protein SufB